jgi:hypothetical protein
VPAESLGEHINRFRRKYFSCMPRLRVRTRGRTMAPRVGQGSSAVATSFEASAFGVLGKDSGPGLSAFAGSNFQTAAARKSAP